MSDHENSGARPSEDAVRLALEVRRLAHDINNALMPLMMGLSVIRRKAGDPSLDRTLTNMETSARRAADLTNEILALGHGLTPPSNEPPK
ncbi:MAG: histidine kinase dimerization/phospho-acceptor domain-containing protein [Thermoanaerobaculia bacterium]